MVIGWCEQTDTEKEIIPAVTRHFGVFFMPSTYILKYASGHAKISAGTTRTAPAWPLRAPEMRGQWTG